MDYKSYLKTNHWQDIKNRFWKSKLNKSCHICGSFNNINLHHRSYKHLWKERIQIDIIALCQNCHHKVHFTHPILGKTPLNWKSLTARMKRLRKRFNRTRPYWQALAGVETTHYK